MPYRGIAVAGTGVLVPPLSAGTAVGACGLDGAEGAAVAGPAGSYRCADPSKAQPAACLPSEAAISISSGRSRTFSTGARVPFRTEATNLSNRPCRIDVSFVGIYVYSAATHELVWDSTGPLDGVHAALAAPETVLVAPGGSVRAPLPATSDGSDAAAWDQRTCNASLGSCNAGAAVPPGSYVAVAMWSQLGGAEIPLTVTS